MTTAKRKISSQAQNVRTPRIRHRRSRRGLRHSRLMAVTNEWLGLSAALSWAVGRLVDRNDLTVYAAPAAAGESFGRINVVTGEVELDGDLLEVPPGTVRPDNVQDRRRYPALWGVLLHEVGHARYTRWQTAVPAWDANSAAMAAARLLEESRIEAALLRRQPRDRRWLRAAVRLYEYQTLSSEDLADAWQTAHVAAVILGRVDAGVLNAHETRRVDRVIGDMLGLDVLDELRRTWREGQTVADTDAATMMELGRRWCEALGLDPDAEVPEAPGEAGDGRLHPVLYAGQDQSADPRGFASSGEDPHRDGNDASANGVSTGVPDHSHSWALRPPTVSEVDGARRLARELRAAAYQETVMDTVASAVPGGRLDMRAALTADAQHAAGAAPTARPWRRVHRRKPVEPKLHVGICCDVSGSMTPFLDPLASAAWMLAWACRWNHGTSATATFGSQVRLVSPPGATRRRVQTFTPENNTQGLDDAIRVLDEALGLSEIGRDARLLIIVTDGGLMDGDITAAEDQLARLKATGCRILVLAPPEHNALTGGHTITLNTATEAPDEIAKAAGRALREQRI